MLKPNYLAEQSVIGAIMLDSKKVMPLAALKLTEDDFYISEFKTIFSACMKLYRQHKAIDSVTLFSVVGDEYKKTVLEAAQLVPSLSNVENYIDAVAEQSKRIKAHEKAVQLVAELEQSDRQITDYQSMVADIAKCFNNKNDNKVVNAEQGFLEFLDRQEHPKEYIGSGFSLLDKFVYIDKGDFVIIGGRPSAGKTAFTLQMLLHMAKKYKVGYFSLETKPSKIFDRLISNYSWTSFNKIKTNSLQDKDWINVTNCFDTFSKLNFDVIPAAGWTAEQVQGYTEVAGYDIVFIDYLTLLRAKGKDDVERATHISKALHIFAQQDNVTVIAISQLSRKGKIELEMTSLRDSGQIEQDADIILLLNYDEDYPDERDLKIAKNKEGKIGKIKFNFDGDLQKFSLVETRYDEH